MKNFPRILIIFSLSLSSFLLSGFTFSTLSSSKSTVIFKIKNAGLTVEGNFSDFSTDIEYKKDKIESGSFKGTIKVASINTGIAMRDKHLKNEDYFNQPKYPNISFISSKVEKSTDGWIDVSGTLTIKNVSKLITLRVNVIPQGEQMLFITALKINRRDYKVGGSSWTLADDLTINLRIVK